VKKLPIGIQTFSKIREDDYYYVDKSELLQKITQAGSYFFLSRPRRFGKSLFLDTLKEAFSGKEALFKGLYLEHNWDWSVRHPVIKIDFGSTVVKIAEVLKVTIMDKLKVISSEEEITFETKSLSENFRELIRKLEVKYKSKVVILIDEYDKPILDNITESDIAKQMRDVLRDFYSVIKTSDAHIQFVFITGVSKFSKVNLFSGLNNIEDITLNPDYSNICGYTDSELSVFQERLVDVDRDELRLWYNGYNFLGDKVYNPFDILLYLKNKQFKNYWCETGNPTFLIDLIWKNNYNIPKIEKIKLTDLSYSSFDIDSISVENLLFQTGYLTIDTVKQIGGNNVYSLCYPNKEVKQSLTDGILSRLTKSITPKENNKINLLTCLEEGNVSELKDIFYAFFASIPHDWYRNNEIAGYEGYYASIFYCYFASIGLDVRPEDPTNHGQSDMVVIMDTKILVLELKILENSKATTALAQIKEKKYYEKYLGSSSKSLDVYLIGVEFSKVERNITSFEWEKLEL
jgi:hypothetical protein